MGQLLLIVVVAVTVAAVVFGVTVLVSGRDAGLQPAEPDGRALPLPTTRPLQESDLGEVRFDLATRGYRMAQVDQAMRRAAYDIGYKDELIGVLEAEVGALREGRVLDADALRRAREAAQAPATTQAGAAEPAKRDWTEFTRPAEADEIATEPAATETDPAGTAEPTADRAAAPADEPAADRAAAAADVPPADRATAPVDEPAAAGELVDRLVGSGATAGSDQPAEQPSSDEPATHRAADEQPAAAPFDQAAAGRAGNDLAATDPAETDRASQAQEPVAEASAEGASPATAAEPATDEAVAPAKARTPARRTATRTSRPTKRTAAPADLGPSAEDADSAKQRDEAETSSGVGTPTEDAGSARR